MSPPIAKGNGYETPPPPPPPPPQGVTAAEMATINMSQVLFVGLRVVGFVTTFIATVVMGTAVQRSTYSGYYSDYETKIKAIDFQFIKYFVAANTIAAIYSLASLGILIPTMRSPSKKMIALVVAIVDLMIVVFLFSSNGAPIAILAIATKNEPCDSSNKFCSQVTGAIVMSMFGAFDYFILVLLSLLGFNQK